MPDGKEHRTAAETTAIIYSAIAVSESGRTMATGTEITAIKEWAKKASREVSTIQ